MNPVDALRSILREGTAVRARLFPSCDNIDHVIETLTARARAGASADVPLDLQRQAVRRFWRSTRLGSLKEARLVSFGLCVPNEPGGQSILDDTLRFSKLLEGIGQWLNDPRRYRRCYHGLLKNYFGYDTYGGHVPAARKRNWTTLRGYLRDHVQYISDEKINPDWVTCVTQHKTVFGESPCDPYAGRMLRGDSAIVDRVRADLGIDDSSWFVRELVLAQIRAAVKDLDATFMELLPRLLEMLQLYRLLRDRGLVLLLDRYAAMVAPPMQEDLRRCAVAWWGSPWLSSNAMWGGVTAPAKAMVSQWLKLEFIDDFFTLLADERGGDRRRLEFWKRYVDAITEIHFALGADTRSSKSRDLVELRNRMRGLTVELRDTNSSNNAFIMWLGGLVVVEFSGKGNALYGYDAQKVPFNVAEAVSSARSARNSLRGEDPRLWLRHQDGVHGFDRWEERFEARLRRDWRIEPSAGSLPSSLHRRKSAEHSLGAPRNAPSGGAIPYSLDALKQFAESHGLGVDDKRSVGGNLWVLCGSSDADISRALSVWGFKFRPNKGWWK